MLTLLLLLSAQEIPGGRGPGLVATFQQRTVVVRDLRSSPEDVPGYSQIAIEDPKLFDTLVSGAVKVSKATPAKAAV